MAVVGESVAGDCGRDVSDVRVGFEAAKVCLMGWRFSSFVAIGERAVLGAKGDGQSCGPLSSSAPHLAHRITPTADGHAHHCFSMTHGAPATTRLGATWCGTFGEDRT